VTGLAHYAGDLVATVPAGCTLHEVNSALRRERQWIPLDPPHEEEATIGGIVAANDSGPRRHAFGAPRDLIIGIEVALSTGTIARSGGRVVKNVAGYDLGRLFCGSRGSLGVITAVTFKLAPLAAASRTVVARYKRPQQAIEAALELARASSITPTCVELATPEPRLLVRFESTERAAERMSRAAVDLLARGSDDVSVAAGEAEDDAWRQQRPATSSNSLEVSVAVLPARAPELFEMFDRLAAADSVGISAIGRAALGVLRFTFTGDLPSLHRAASKTRETVAGLGGHMQVVGGSDLLPPDFDRFGATPGASAIARAIKQQFDPARVLPYPWAWS
jgi:glycolate oxidase FAD binding subunit